MAYDRNKYIYDRLIRIGISSEKTKNEYYHKELDTAYDYCMLLLRTKAKNRIHLINDALCKLRKLDIPPYVKQLTLQQKVIILTMKLDNMYCQYVFLELVRQVIRALK